MDFSEVTQLRRERERIVDRDVGEDVDTIDTKWREDVGRLSKNKLNLVY